MKMRRPFAATFLLALFLMVGATMAQQPNFGPALYGDGEVWGTKAVTALPGVRGNNLRSFDKLFVIVNGAAGQMPVAESAPGNPSYNGGRWYTHTVMWTEEGLDYHGMPLPVLKSYDEIMVHLDLGHLAIASGSPTGGPPPFFECPLLPVK